MVCFVGGYKVNKTGPIVCVGSSSVLIGSHCFCGTGDRREITPSDAAQWCPDWPVNQTRPCPQDLRAPCEGFAENPLPGRWSILLRPTLSVLHTHGQISLWHTTELSTKTKATYIHTLILLHFILDFPFHVNHGTFQIFVLKILTHTHTCYYIFSFLWGWRTSSEVWKSPWDHPTLRSNKNKEVISFRMDWSCVYSWDGFDASAHEHLPRVKFSGRCHRHVWCPIGGSKWLERTVKHRSVCGVDDATFKDFTVWNQTLCAGFHTSAGRAYSTE